LFPVLSGKKSSEKPLKDEMATKGIEPLTIGTSVTKDPSIVENNMEG